MSSMESSQATTDLSQHIELGCTLSVQAEGIKERLSSFLVGMVPTSYIIIQTPVVIDHEYLISERKRLVIRYMSHGEVFGFKAIVLRSITDPTKLTFLSYPQQIEKINLRKHSRINSIIPSSLSHGENTTIKGVIQNLSTEGTKFTTKNNAGMTIEDINVGDEVSILFPLPGIDGNQELHGTIRYASNEKAELRFGIEFDGTNAAAVRLIDAYIDQVKDYIEN